jgi:hypothetical protein
MSMIWLSDIHQHISLPMTPDKEHPSHQASLSGSEALAGQIAGLIRLIRSREEDNMQEVEAKKHGSIPSQRHLLTGRSYSKR